jgi:pimeloyl-ACP methyl ester carboxylesterase
MKTTFVRVSTKDNLELHGLLYEPDKPTKKAILHVHGMAGNFYENRFLDNMAKTYTAGGHTFCTFNNRGHDYIADFRKTDTNENKFVRIGEVNEKFEECVLDVEAWINFLNSKGYNQIVLQGHSLGTVKVAFYQATKMDSRVNGIVLASPSDMLGLIKGEKDFAEFMETAQKMVLQGKGKELMPKQIWNEYPITAETFLNFFSENSKTAIFNIFEKKPSVLAKIKVPIFAFLGSQDDVIIKTPEKDFEILKSIAKNCPRFETYVIKGAIHVYFKHEQEVADRILEFCKSL